MNELTDSVVHTKSRPRWCDLSQSHAVKTICLLAIVHLSGDWPRNLSLSTSFSRFIEIKYLIFPPFLLNIYQCLKKKNLLHPSLQSSWEMLNGKWTWGLNGLQNIVKIPAQLYHWRCLVLVFKAFMLIPYFIRFLQHLWKRDKVNTLSLFSKWGKMKLWEIVTHSVVVTK